MSESQPLAFLLSPRRTLALGAAVFAAFVFAPSGASAQCVNGGPQVTLMDSASFIWDIGTNGQIDNGSIDAYDEGMALSVNGVYFPIAATRTMELSGRQIVHGPFMTAGLQVTRKVYVPTTDRWARFLEVFRNPGTTAITATVRIETNCGSDGGTIWTGSSSGDTAFSTADRWVTTDDSDGGGDPSLNHNFWGAGGALQPMSVGTSVFDCAAPNGPFVQYSLTVPAGGVAILMHFGGQNNTRADSTTNAQAIDRLPASTLTGLTAEEAASIRNWAVCGTMDLDGDGVSCAAGDCNDGNREIRPGATELCDAIDNNCNMMVDEGFNVGAACMAGSGACTAAGRRVCASDRMSAVCDAMPGMAGTELCGDMIDNDCDGMVDEGFNAGMACSVGVGACARTGTIACSADRRTASCNATAGMSGAELCGDLVDNDCDGMTDEGFNVGEACMAGVGACRMMGTQVCATDRMGTTCNAMAAMPGTERCDGVDNNCDGMTDEGAALCTGETDGARCVTMGATARCGCTADADCGDAMSGRICDTTTSRCMAGCGVGMGRNGCAAGQFCSSDDPSRAGVCTMSCNFDGDCASMMGRTHCRTADGGPDPSNQCVECTTDTHCAGRTDGRSRCIGEGGTCAQCSATSRDNCMASGAGSACLMSGLCGCTSDSDCAADRRCNVSMNQCEARPAKPDAGPTDSGPSEDASADVPVTDVGPVTDVAVSDAGTPTMDSGTPTDSGAPADKPVATDLGKDTGTPTPPSGSSSSGCGCHVPGESPTRAPHGGVIVLGALALAFKRRRRAS
jgi:MYXO-CTERM domain-containing protein